MSKEIASLYIAMNDICKFKSFLFSGGVALNFFKIKAKQFSNICKES